jgi:hypothetical protein
MADASKAMLRMGNRDSSQIVLFAKKVCGNALTTYLSGQGRLSAKDADAFIEALAYDQLSGIPGVQYRPAAEAQKNEKDGYVVAVGAFANPAPVVAQLKSEGIPHYTESSGALVRVKAGPFVSKEAAESARVKLGALGFKPGDTKVSSNATKD